MWFILLILLFAFTIFTISHAWQHLSTSAGWKVVVCALILIFGWIAALVYWIYVLVKPQPEQPEQPEQLPKAVKKIGQQSQIKDVGSALADIENRYKRFHRMVYGDDYGFGHFYALSDSRKEMIVRPFIRVAECGMFHFSRIQHDGNEFSNHYDYFLGLVDENQKRKFGVYSWEWEEDEEGDTSIDYFVGDFENGQPKQGVWYHLSSEDAKIWVKVDGEFYISAINGVSTYR